MSFNDEGYFDDRPNGLSGTPDPTAQPQSPPAGDELDTILPCNCGMNDLLNGKHYDDCPKALAPALNAYILTILIDEFQNLEHDREAAKGPDRFISEYVTKRVMAAQARFGAEKGKDNVHG